MNKCVLCKRHTVYPGYSWCVSCSAKVMNTHPEQEMRDLALRIIDAYCDGGPMSDFIGLEGVGCIKV